MPPILVLVTFMFTRAALAVKLSDFYLGIGGPAKQVKINIKCINTEPV